jgi:hypothetical protein
MTDDPARSRLDQYEEKRRSSPVWIVTDEARLNELLEYPAVKERQSGVDLWLCTKEIVYEQTPDGPSSRT